MVERLEYIEHNIELILKKSIVFQNEFLKKDKKDFDPSDILMFESKELLLMSIPYFYLQDKDDNFNRIFDINQKLISRMNNIYEKNKSLVTICLNKIFFKKNSINELNNIITTYKQHDNSYFSLWINDFSF
ncbi:MAG: hypothetical protein ACRCXQ_05725 [Vagococcus fluvialis]